MMEDTPFLFYNLCKERIKLQCKWGKWRPMQGSSGRTEVWGVLLKNLSFFFFYTHTSQHPNSPLYLPSLMAFSLLLRIPFNIFYVFTLHFYDHLLAPSSANKCKVWGRHNRTVLGKLLTVQRSINSSPEVISYISRRCSLMTKKSSCYWGIVQNVYSFV